LKNSVLKLFMIKNKIVQSPRIPEVQLYLFIQKMTRKMRDNLNQQKVTVVKFGDNYKSDKKPHA